MLKPGCIILLHIQKCYNVTQKLRVEAYGCEGNLPRLASVLRVRPSLYASGDILIPNKRLGNIAVKEKEKKGKKKKKKGKKKGGNDYQL
jgi:hypothetical protein